MSSLNFSTGLLDHFSISGLGSLRGDAERAVEAEDEAQSPEEPSPEQIAQLSTPDAKRKLDVDGIGGIGGIGSAGGVVQAVNGGYNREDGSERPEADEEDVPQTFERRRKKSKMAGGGVGVAHDFGGSQGSEEQASEKENTKGGSNICRQTDVVTTSSSGERMMTEADFSPSIAGAELVIYWPGKYSDWFGATVQRFDTKGKKMTVQYHEDGYKANMDLRRVKGLIDKGWIKVRGDFNTGPNTTEGIPVGGRIEETTNAELEPQVHDEGKTDIGCSKCRYRGCKKCRGYTLAEEKLRKAREAQQAREAQEAREGKDQAERGEKSRVDEQLNGHKGGEHAEKEDKSETEKPTGNAPTELRPMRESDFGPSLQGKELSVFWTWGFNQWYRATVDAFNNSRKRARIHYDHDGYREWVDLKKIKSLIKKDRIKIAVGDDDDGHIDESGDANDDLGLHQAGRANDDDELDLSQELSQEEGLRYVTKDEFGPELQGRTLNVYWGRGFNAWFRATVLRFDEKSRKAYLYYAVDNHHDVMDSKKFANLVSKARVKLFEDEVLMDVDPSSSKEVVRLMTRQDMGHGLKGKEVVIFWTDERYKGWYEATVRSFNRDEGLMTLGYRKDKTRETVDPTLMYIPEGRIGFIEKRPGDHQLVRGELDVRLLDIKGRALRRGGNGATKEMKGMDEDRVGTGQSDRQDLLHRDEEGSREKVEEDGEEEEEEEELSEEPSEDEEPSASPVPRREEAANTSRPVEEVAQDPIPGASAFEFGYDGGDDRDYQTDAGERADAGYTGHGTIANIATSNDALDHCIADSYNASPNPSPSQPQRDPTDRPGQREAEHPPSPGPDQLLSQLHLQGNPELEQEHRPQRPVVAPEIAEPQPSPSQPSVDPWENDRAATIFRWLTTSLAHPLSRQAKLAKLRPSLQEAVDFMRDNVRDTIEKSFNNSILVVGAPGSGKTLAVSRVIRQVQEEWNNKNAHNPSDSTATTTAVQEPRVGIVRLSGVEFSDERAAFREIARQLCESLNLDYVKTASLGDNIQFLLQILKALSQAGKAAVFVLEEFDLFAHTQKQTFLYCLLDSLQKSQAKAIVIGTTCRHDCLDLLEKRVKSRFSHRSITLTPPTTLEDGDVHGSGAKSILTDILSVPDGAVVGADRYNDQVLLAMEDPSVLEGLSRTIQFSNSLHMLSRIARKALSAWYTSQSAVDNDSDEPLPFAARHIAQAMDEINVTSTAGFESTISKLCPLDLSVLAAAYKAKAGRNDGLLNFEMVHHEFKTFITSSNLHVDNYSRAAASKSFERLVDCGILRHPRSKGGSLSRRDRHFAPVLVQVTRTELQQGLQRHFNASRQLIDWALRGEIHTTALNEY